MTRVRPSIIILVLVGILVATVVALSLYSRHHLQEWLSPGGALVQNILPGVFLMAIEISIISLVVTYIIDLQWRPARVAIMADLATDAFSMALLVHSSHYLIRLSLDREGFNDWWIETAKKIEANDVREQMQMMAPAFSPQISKLVVQYIRSREKVNLELRTGLYFAKRHDIATPFAACLHSDLPQDCAPEYALMYYRSAKLVLAIDEHLDECHHYWYRSTHDVSSDALEILRRRRRALKQFVENFDKHNSLDALQNSESA